MGCCPAHLEGEPNPLPSDTGIYWEINGFHQCETNVKQAENEAWNDLGTKTCLDPELNLPMQLQGLLNGTF